MDTKQVFTKIGYLLIAILVSILLFYKFNNGFREDDLIKMPILAIIIYIMIELLLKSNKNLEGLYIENFASMQKKSKKTKKSKGNKKPKKSKKSKDDISSQASASDTASQVSSDDTASQASVSDTASQVSSDDASSQTSQKTPKKRKSKKVKSKKVFAEQPITNKLRQFSADKPKVFQEQPKRQSSPGRQRSPGRKRSPGRQISPNKPRVFQEQPRRQLSPDKSRVFQEQPGRQRSPRRQPSPGRQRSPGRQLSPRVSEEQGRLRRASEKLISDKKKSFYGDDDVPDNLVSRHVDEYYKPEVKDTAKEKKIMDELKKLKEDAKKLKEEPRRVPSPPRQEEIVKKPEVRIPRKPKIRLNDAPLDLKNKLPAAKVQDYPKPPKKFRDKKQKQTLKMNGINKIGDSDESEPENPININVSYNNSHPTSINEIPGGMPPQQPQMNQQMMPMMYPVFLPNMMMPNMMNPASMMNQANMSMNTGNLDKYTFSTGLEKDDKVRRGSIQESRAKPSPVNDVTRNAALSNVNQSYYPQYLQNPLNKDQPGTHVKSIFDSNKDKRNCFKREIKDNKQANRNIMFGNTLPQKYDKDKRHQDTIKQKPKFGTQDVSKNNWMKSNYEVTMLKKILDEKNDPAPVILENPWSEWAPSN